MLFMTFIVASMSSLNVTQAQQTPNKCEERIKDCEQVIDAANLFIGTLNKQLSNKDELITKLETDIELLQQQVAATSPVWYEQPSFVIPATIITTVATIFVIRRALP
jgi:peptidoglycan hydrolase CwlO-like protein